jgi:hypothetical protein
VAVTYASFISARPEFNNTSITQASVEAAIADAEDQIDEEVWGDQTDIGVSLLAAHLVAISPHGQAARLVAKDGSTTYYKRYCEMRDNVGGAWVSVVG